jgi:ATP-binding cassette subfamily F protein 3
MAPLDMELKALDAKLADEHFYTEGDPDEVATTLKKRGESALKLQELEARWLEISEELESIQ